MRLFQLTNQLDKTIHFTGEGSFGTVFRGAFRDEAVAIKTVRVSKVNAEALEKFKYELVSRALTAEQIGSALLMLL